MMECTGNRIWFGTAVMALLLSLAACGEDLAAPGSESSPTSEGTQDTPVQQEPAEDYAIDECLVGVWTTVSQRDVTTVNDEQVILIDVQRQLSFASDGLEVVSYFDTPAAVQSPTGESIGEVSYSGELSYRISTDEPGTISFEPAGGEVSVIFDIRGQSSTFTSEGGSGPVTYTCSAAEHTQELRGLRGSVYARHVVPMSDRNVSAVQLVGILVVAGEPGR